MQGWRENCPDCWWNCKCAQNNSARFYQNHNKHRKVPQNNLQKMELKTN